MYFKIILSILLFCVVSNSAVYYVSPTGSDTNPGTIDLPFATIPKAMQVAVAGDTIFVRGGTHVYNTTIAVPKSGNASKRLYLLAYPGERPLLDFSSMAVGDANRGIYLNRSYWIIRGLDIKGAGDNGMYMTGSNNLIEDCGFLENRDSGLQLSGGASNNQIINCDSYYNADPSHGNADGFAPKLTVGSGNYFYGCRAWQNSDDGFDGYLRGADDVTTTYEHCWAFKNGYLKNGTPSSGNGNGFKMGGSDDRTLMHNVIMKNCFAFENRVKGFDQNNNKGSMTLYHCTGHNNGTNYSLSTALNTGKTLTIINCVVLGAVGSIGSFAIQQTNSWMPPFNVTSADFISTNSSAAYGPRKPDGNLPDITYMHLAPGSQLIDAGTDVGLPYCGTKPDLGAFETTPNYVLTINSVNGSVDRNPDQTNYTCGTLVHLTAIPETGYNFVNWSGDLSGSNNPTTIIVNNNKTVTANFALKQYEVTASVVGGNGYVSPSHQLVDHGSSAIVNIFPNEGYYIASIQVNGNAVEISNPLIIENVTFPQNVIVTFALKTYTITASAGDNGTINPSGEVIITHGNDTTFNFLPASGFQVDSVFVDGIYVGSPDFYSFQNVHSNHTIFVKFSEAKFILTVAVNKGWNMVSVPLQVQDYKKSELFPTSTSQAFMYDGSYFPKDTLENGVGYWLKFSGSSNIAMPGTPILSDSIPVKPGWNMIGSISYPISTTDIIPSFELNILSSFYKFQGGYAVADTIYPGKAYWVKVSGTGTLYLDRSSISKSVSRESRKLEKFNSITISDASGTSQTLYFGIVNDEKFAVDYYELPPVPPQGVFDVRFKSQRKVELHPSTVENLFVFPISISSALFPLTVNWNISETNLVDYELRYDDNSVALLGNSSVRITNLSIESLSLTAVNKKFVLEEIFLSQNYPNPFNSSTQIQFATAKSARTTLEVYNTLGQKVATIFDHVVEANKHYHVNFNAETLPSGIYLYKLQSEHKIAMKKLLLLK